MWVIAEYEATALFSLKPAHATASGGRTLLVPTPYAIKMALLDVVCRVEGVAVAETVCDWLSEAQVALRPPQQVVVNNTFIKVLRPRRNPAKPGSQDAGFFGPTITYREFAQFGDTFSIALEVDAPSHAKALQKWLMHINYLGKRGSFIQIQAVPSVTDDMPAAFIPITGEIGASFQLHSVMTQLDDTSVNLTFKQASPYSSGSGSTVKLGKDRLLKHVILPYRLVSSSRGYSFYELSS
ncbi:MAG: hypothetical protein Q9P01_05630 [Anaerolineae bacterium]|nr:hypothetical protein [Anaerolineae bacterium]MDQ7034317.1 hypothetical protein [Anaerolineae bacterium]